MSIGTMQKFSNVRDRGSSLFSGEAGPANALSRRPALHSWCGLPTKPHQACSGRGFVSIPFIGRWEKNCSTPKTWKYSTLEPPPPTAHWGLFHNHSDVAPSTHGPQTWACMTISRVVYLSENPQASTHKDDSIYPVVGPKIRVFSNRELCWTLEPP